MDASTPRDGETDPFILAEQKRWLDLARLGKEAWNTWAEAELKKPLEDRVEVDFSGQEIEISGFGDFIFPAEVDFSDARFSVKADFRAATFSAGADFIQATFSGYADFREATFAVYADFSQTTFSADADFRETTFSNYAFFTQAIFSADADFRETTFADACSFNSARMKSVWQLNGARVAGSLFAHSAEIEGHAYFTAIDFNFPPNLTSTSFSQPPSFLGSTFRYPCSNWISGKCDVGDGEARFRRLKQLAADTHDHELELRLFALETKAKRFHTLKLANPLHWPGLVLNFGYGWVSDFGQSVLRPLGWLMVTILFALFAFEAMTDLPDMLARGLIDFSTAAKVAAFVNVVPFAGQAVLGREIMTKGLCPMDEGAPEYLDCLTTLYTISAVEGVFGLIFLFLIGLGLRNRFRIK